MKMKIQKQFVPEEARQKYSFLKKTSKKEKYNPTKNIYMYLRIKSFPYIFRKGKTNKEVTDQKAQLMS